MTDTTDPQTAVELVDLVDKHGTVCRTRVPRPDADSAQSLYLPIVTVVTAHADGRILTHRRPDGATAAPGAVDHACGAIRSGEHPDDAARRETAEETGALLDSLRLVDTGVNCYGRYQHLYAATTSTPLHGLKAGADFVTAARLRQDARDGRVFVDGFFEDLARTLPAPVAVPPAVVAEPGKENSRG